MRAARLLPAVVLGLAMGFTVPAALAEPLPLLLAETYRGQVDVSRYLASEKLDGVRAAWDGKVLRFRSGREINAPRWFLEGLPARPLDGELWLGRGSFERLSGIVRRETPDDGEWRQVRYMVFELPDGLGIFGERAAALREIAGQAGVPWLQAVEQFPVADRVALREQLEAIIAAGGEGLMLHRSDAPYRTGRSDILLKMKPWNDADAEVIGWVPGRGKHAGSMGALRLRTPEGREFFLGTGFSDEVRRHPPPPGKKVTYRYRDLTTRGLPRFASFLRTREDE